MSFLLTHSLLSSWLYAMKDNPYEDLTTERDYMAEFMQTLRREPTPTSDAMQNGIDFEDLVTDIVLGKDCTDHKWYGAAARVAGIVGGGRLQYKASKGAGLPALHQGHRWQLRDGMRAGAGSGQASAGLGA